MAIAVDGIHRSQQHPEMTIKAVTFDLWDTVFDDESDEPKRLAAGLLGKAETRHKLLFEALQHHHEVSRADVDLAYAVANAAFYKVWQEASITWTCRERLQVLLNGLGKPLPDDELTTLADAMGQLEVDVPPDILPGLRDILAHHDLLQYFSGFAFSDEVGRSKPDAAMFESAQQQMGVSFEQMIHIGDRDNKDIKGAQAVGMKAILYTEKRDADRYTTSADAVCTTHSDLAGIINAFAEG